MDYKPRFDRQIHGIWTTSGHGSLWNSEGTYTEIPFSLLPTIPPVDDSWNWLAQEDEVGYGIDWDDREGPRAFDFAKSIGEFGFEVPEDIFEFLSNDELQLKVPSCTDCFLELSSSIIKLNCFPDQFLFRFLNDSQFCVMWYLLFQPGEPVKVVSSNHILDLEILGETNTTLSHDQAVCNSRLSALSFKEFIYRFWVENVIWFSERDGIIYSDRQAEYISQRT